MGMVHRSEKGFTMAELLVVIAIMAILVGVAVGSFTGLIGSGKSESAKYEYEAVQTAVDAYIAVEGGTATMSAGTDTQVTSSEPFGKYMRRLPTAYKYTWNKSGSVTQGDKAS